MTYKEAAINRVKRGKKVIGLGSRRIVFDIGNGSVLKVAKTKYGIISNKREVATYQSSVSTVKKHLAKIIDYSKTYRWVVMEKHARHFPKSITFKRKLRKLRNHFRKNGIVPYEILSNSGKPNYNNLRKKRNGMIVVIDYGNFRFRRKI
jgi:hypothetical protein